MKNQATSPLTPPEQENRLLSDVPWLCNWFQPDNNNEHILLNEWEYFQLLTCLRTIHMELWTWVR